MKANHATSPRTFFSDDFAHDLISCYLSVCFYRSVSAGDKPAVPRKDNSVCFEFTFALEQNDIATRQSLRFS